MSSVLSPTKTKVFTLTELKLDTDGEGTFVAAFANLDAIDHDGDGYDPGAIGTQKVKISVWNHGSWGSGAEALPVGVGQTFEQRDSDGTNWAKIKGEFDLGREAGVEHYKALKYFTAKGHAVEWSFALPDADWRMEERDGQRIRIFTRIMVPEVSPVLLGAGIDTHLESIKALEDTMVPTEKRESTPLAKQLDEAVEAVEAVIGRAKEVSNLRHDDGEDLGRRSKRRLKHLRDAMQDCIEDVDNLLRDPNEELRRIAEALPNSYMGGT